MSKGKMPRRKYRGEDLSIIGFGGIVVTNAEQEHANRIVPMAIERGINYFDVAPGYGDAEIKLGPALEPYRKDCFLATKTAVRDKEGARMEFDRSLERLRTDYFDLYQLHGIMDVEKDVDAAFAKGGAMEVIEEAKKNGQVRYVGFSAHTVEAAFAAMDRYDFDSILFPINFATFYAGNFGPQVVERAQEKGMEILALKAMAREMWPENDPLRQVYSKCWYKPVTDPHLMRMALRWTLSQPVCAAVPPGEEQLFWHAVEFAESFTPLESSEEKEMQQLAKEIKAPLFKMA